MLVSELLHPGAHQLELLLPLPPHTLRIVQHGAKAWEEEGELGQCAVGLVGGGGLLLFLLEGAGEALPLLRIEPAAYRRARRSASCSSEPSSRKSPT